MNKYIDKGSEVINGDCLEILKTYKDNSIDCIITDPPYGMDYQSNRRKVKMKKIYQDNNLKWSSEFFKYCYRVMKNNTHIYIFCNDNCFPLFYIEMKKYFNMKKSLVWIKNNHSAGDLKGDYGNKTEYIIYAQKGFRELNGTRSTNVLPYNRVSSELHPTQKPLELIKFLIQKSTQPNEIVFDPFAGSGTTLVAAKELGRKYTGIEIDSGYCEVIKNRLSQELLF